MKTRIKQTLRMFAVAAVVFAALAGPAKAGQSTPNGLWIWNGLTSFNGLWIWNGLTSFNGLWIWNGLTGAGKGMIDPGKSLSETLQQQAR